MNSNPRWPEGYYAALREAGAQERTLPFYATWVRRFFARFPGRSRRSLGRPEIEVFLSEMARRTDISNWQIAQARDALELYYEQFRGIALAPRPDQAVSTTSSPTSLQPQQEDGLLPATAPAIRKPIAVPSAPYQNQRATVKAISHAEKQENRLQDVPRGQNSPVRAPLPKGAPEAPPGKTNWRLLEARVRECLRVAHYSYRTEQTYLGWIRKFVAFHQGRKPSTMDAGHVRDFLRHLAMDRQVAASTQNQALNAVVYLSAGIMWTSSISSELFARRSGRRA